MIKLNAVDRRRERKRLLKPAIRYLHLVIRHAGHARPVLSTPGDIQLVALNFYLDVLSGNARKLDLYDPAGVGLINISGREPKRSRRLHVL